VQLRQGGGQGRIAETEYADHNGAKIAKGCGFALTSAATP
jgi:hypothetical protein